MDGPQHILELLRDRGLIVGHLRGVFHLLIGRKIFGADGALLSPGVSWRELSALLKLAKYDRDFAVELGADPETISPKDREKFWYAAILLAKVDSTEAREQADQLAVVLSQMGYSVGAPPGVTKPMREMEPPKKKGKKK